MIGEGEAAIPVDTTRRAFRNQEKSRQRSAIEHFKMVTYCSLVYFQITKNIQGHHVHVNFGKIEI